MRRKNKKNIPGGILQEHEQDCNDDAVADSRHGALFDDLAKPLLTTTNLHLTVDDSALRAFSASRLPSFSILQ
jgi:hypothetical protein